MIYVLIIYYYDYDYYDYYYIYLLEGAHTCKSQSLLVELREQLSGQFPPTTKW